MATILRILDAAGHAEATISGRLSSERREIPVVQLRVFSLNRLKALFFVVDTVQQQG
jgi:hypothetical protein